VIFTAGEQAGFVQELKSEPAPYHLLKHAFYKKWDKGEVSRVHLKILCRSVPPP